MPKNQARKHKRISKATPAMVAPAIIPGLVDCWDEAAGGCEFCGAPEDVVDTESDELVSVVLDVKDEDELDVESVVLVEVLVGATR